jgi:predicted Mrr-cat superfamily restriction endonuclease
MGWKEINPGIAAHPSREELWEQMRQKYPDGSLRTISNWTGQLYRFWQECSKDDYVLYYDPPRKSVQICRVVSGHFYRDFEMEANHNINIWHCHSVVYPVEPIPILDLYGPLKGRLLGPRLGFWELSDCFETVDALAQGRRPQLAAAPDPEIVAAYTRLRDLVTRRLEALNDIDWEWLVVDYVKAQGAHVNEAEIGGSRPIIDVEAKFDHGEFGDEVWRIQVKRYQDQKVDWPQIESDLELVGDSRFCYVSVFGFTPQARTKADAAEVLLLEGGDFALFALGGKVRDSIRSKLSLPLA